MGVHFLTALGLKGPGGQPGRVLVKIPFQAGDGQVPLCLHVVEGEGHSSYW